MNPDRNDPVVERLFEGLQPAPPPSELRAKALQAARRQAAAGHDEDLWSRLWHHRGLRLAWAGSVIALLAGHIAVSASRVGPTIDPTLVAEHRVDEYLAGFLGPAQISDNVQPIVGLLAAADGLAELDLQRNPS
jgi:hypothetical protein